jgi:hypothetical protein
MKIKKKLSLIAFICISFIANAQQKLTSPDGNLEIMGHRTKRFFQWSGKMGERF